MTLVANAVEFAVVTALLCNFSIASFLYTWLEHLVVWFEKLHFAAKCTI